ncbi:MAG: hypothetical protein ACPGJE_05495 [Wenzhouxiangellaceae bacterium]
MNHQGDAPNERESSDAIAPQGDINAFTGRWRSAIGKEQANYQFFLTKLCRLLGPTELATYDSERDDHLFNPLKIFEHSPVEPPIWSNK